MLLSASDKLAIAIALLVVLSVSLASNPGGGARCGTTNGRNVTESFGGIKMVIAQIRNHIAERNALVRDGFDRQAQLAPIMALVCRVAYRHQRSMGYCAS
jgi:hypothetical protein